MKAYVIERAGRMPSLRSCTFDFDEVRRAHSLIESDRALGKFVVLSLSRPIRNSSSCTVNKTASGALPATFSPPPIR